MRHPEENQHPKRHLRSCAELSNAVELETGQTHSDGNGGWAVSDSQYHDSIVLPSGIKSINNKISVIRSLFISRYDLNQSLLC